MDQSPQSIGEIPSFSKIWLVLEKCLLKNIKRYFNRVDHILIMRALRTYYDYFIRFWQTVHKKGSKTLLPSVVTIIFFPSNLWQNNAKDNTHLRESHLGITGKTKKVKWSSNMANLKYLEDLWRKSNTRTRARNIRGQKY